MCTKNLSAVRNCIGYLFRNDIFTYITKKVYINFYFQLYLDSFAFIRQIALKKLTQ